MWKEIGHFFLKTVANFLTKPLNFKFNITRDDCLPWLRFAESRWPTTSILHFTRFHPLARAWHANPTQITQIREPKNGQDQGDETVRFVFDFCNFEISENHIQLCTYMFQFISPALEICIHAIRGCTTVWTNLNPRFV